MALSYAEAYQQIKTLENSGQLNLPEPQGTVSVGTVDAQTGAFTWSIPTETFTFRTITPVDPNKPPLQPLVTKPVPVITTLIVGMVDTAVVDLLLKFNVTNSPGLLPVTATKAHATPHGGTVDHAVLVGKPIPIGTAVVSIASTDFKTVLANSTEILLDAGMTCSTPLTSGEKPPFSFFLFEITTPKGKQQIHLGIFRAPILGVGVFTIPALLMALVYAPPQGLLNKNTAQYSDTTSYTRTIVSSVSNSTATKTMQAYSAADLLDKVSKILTAAAGAAGGAPALKRIQNHTDPGAGATAGAGGAAAGAGGATGAGKGSASAAGAKQASAQFELVSNIITAITPTVTSSDSSTITEQTDQTVSLSTTNMTSFEATTGQTTGMGDRYLCFQDVKVLWMAINGEVGIHVLGWSNTDNPSTEGLITDLQALAAGQIASASHLDAATIRSLLALNPFYHPGLPASPVLAGPAPISAPRFIPAFPISQTGQGTGPAGDIVSVTADVITDTKQTQTSATTTVTDVKPGWLNVIFGAPDTETTTTITLSTVQSVDDKTEDKITSQITFFTEPNEAYDVKFFTDLLFGTYLAIDSNSPLLLGSPGIGLAH